MTVRAMRRVELPLEAALTQELLQSIFSGGTSRVHHWLAANASAAWRIDGCSVIFSDEVDGFMFELWTGTAGQQDDASALN